MNTTLELKNKEDLTLEKYLDNLREFQLDTYFETNVLARAYELQNGVEVKITKAEHITTMVSGRYIVDLIKNENHIGSSCECPYPLACKHQAASILYLMAARTSI